MLFNTDDPLPVTWLLPITAAVPVVKVAELTPITALEDEMVAILPETALTILLPETTPKLEDASWGLLWLFETQLSAKLLVSVPVITGLIWEPLIQLSNVACITYVWLHGSDIVYKDISRIAAVFNSYYYKTHPGIGWCNWWKKLLIILTIINSGNGLWKQYTWSAW